MKTVTIDVTAEDIREGMPNACSRCPVALAILRHLKCGHSAHVNLAYISIERRFDQAAFTRTSDEVRRFIEDFDDDKFVKPFSFTLELPEEVLRDGQATA